MGKVAMGYRTEGYHAGYPLITATVFIYCDQCGSFSIKKHITWPKRIVLAACVAGAVIGREQLGPWLLLCGIPLALFALVVWQDIMVSYKCRKCGNQRISDYNALHYSPYDKSVVDVPDRSAQKLYMYADDVGFSRFE